MLNEYKESRRQSNAKEEANQYLNALDQFHSCSGLDNYITRKCVSMILSAIETLSYLFDLQAITFY